MNGTPITIVAGPRQGKAGKQDRKVYHWIPRILKCTAPLLLLLLDQGKARQANRPRPDSLQRSLPLDSPPYSEMHCSAAAVDVTGPSQGVAGKTGSRGAQPREVYHLIPHLMGQLSQWPPAKITVHPFLSVVRWDKPSSLTCCLKNLWSKTTSIHECNIESCIA